MVSASLVALGPFFKAWAVIVAATAGVAGVVRSAVAGFVAGVRVGAAGLAAAWTALVTGVSSVAARAGSAAARTAHSAVFGAIRVLSYLVWEPVRLIRGASEATKAAAGGLGRSVTQAVGGWMLGVSRGARSVVGGGQAVATRALALLLSLVLVPAGLVIQAGRGLAAVSSRAAGLWAPRPLAGLTPSPPTDGRSGVAVAPPSAKDTVPPLTVGGGAERVVDLSALTPALREAIRAMTAEELAKWTAAADSTLAAHTRDVEAKVAAKLTAAEQAATARLDAFAATAAGDAARRDEVLRAAVAEEAAVAAAATVERARAVAAEAADATCSATTGSCAASAASLSAAAAAAARDAASAAASAAAAAASGPVAVTVTTPTTQTTTTTTTTKSSTDDAGVTGVDIDSLADRVIERYEADKGRPADYALLSVGARVEASSPSQPNAVTFYAGTYAASLFGRGTSSRLYVPAYPNPPETVFTPGVVPGNCWSFPGVGTITVRLARPVAVTSFTMEHTPGSSAFSSSAAPAAFRVTGIPFVWPPARGAVAGGGRRRRPDASAAAAATAAPADGGVGGPAVSAASAAAVAGASPPGQLLGEYVYRVGGGRSHMQVFPVSPSAPGAGTPMRAVTLEVTSNHGNPHYTCLYRFRVHGPEADAGVAAAAGGGGGI